MPLRNSFSIRRLFSSPRRFSHMADEPVSATATAPLSTKRSLDRSKRSANNTPRSSDVIVESPLLHPDSSITTPQAERGLVDNVVHELSQDEIDRIKAVVAAAAAAAATSLRLRIQAEEETNEAIGSTLTPTSPGKKSRRVPQPIVVPPQPLSLIMGTRAGQCCDSRQSLEGNDIKEEEEEDDGAKDTPPDLALPFSTPCAASLSAGGSCALAHLAQPLLAVAGNSKSDANSSNTGAARQRGSKAQKEEGGKPEQNEQKEGTKRRDENEKDDKDGKNDQSPPGPASRSPARASPLTKPANLDSTRLASSASDPAHRPMPVFDPPPTLHHKKPAHFHSHSRTSRSLPVISASTPAVSKPLHSTSHSTSHSASHSASPAAPRLSSIFSARHKDTPEPAKHVARSKSRARLRSKKPRTSPQSGTRRNKAKTQSQPSPSPTPQIQTLARETPLEEIDPESLIHPVYRGQSAQPDEKKDSGISLDKSKPGLGLSSIDKETLLSKTADHHEHGDSDSEVSLSDSDSDSGSGSCLDLLQALAIQPEEAIQLHQSELAQAHANMPSFDSMRSTIRIERADTKIDTKIDSAVPAPLFDGAITPTFTRPRRAPSPAVPPVPQTLQTLQTPKTHSRPLPSSRPLLVKSSSLPTTTATTTATTAISTKKQPRFLPTLRLTKGGPSADASITRKRSKKVSARKRAAVAQAASKQAPLPSGSHVDLGGKGSSSSSRWALPDNVTELFNGRLFNRMEVTETLSFEKLQAIRQSRALAENQKREREAKAEELDRSQGAQLADAEQALLEALERPVVATDAALSSLAKDSEQDDHAQSSVETKDNTADVQQLEQIEQTEELEVSPLEPDVPSADGDPFPVHVAREQLVDITVSPTSPTLPVLDDSKSRLPPVHPLPPPPHIASQMVWHDDDDDNDDDDDASNDDSPPSPSGCRDIVSTKILLPEATEPDGSTTPLEPFHMQDLPSRIDAASVRVSILLPVEEEEAYFASSVAEHKERRRREREEQEKEAVKEKKEVAIESETESLAGNKSAHAPSPPSKNPRRVSMQEHGTSAPLPAQLAIPRVTVTDVDSHGQHSVVFSLPASRPPRSRSPNSPKKTKSGKNARARSSRSIPSSSITTASQRDEETYVYLPATPFSLVMPSFRHGPVRLLRPEQDSVFFSSGKSGISGNSGNSGSSLGMSASPVSTRRKHMAAVDDTLDWTAFQMAILGGAGDFFQESVDFGRTSAAEVDEADSLSEWYLSMGFYPERLLTSEDDDSDLASAPAKQTPQEPTAARAPAPLLANYQHAHWASFGSASDSSYNDYSARHSGQSDKSSCSNKTTHSMQSSQSSLPVRFSDHFSIDAGSVVSGNVVSGNVGSGNNSTTTLAPPAGRPRPVEILGTEVPGELPGSVPEALDQQHHHPSRHRKNTASCASFDSYESMPQSPMADLVMTRGADGKEYVTPMGYNLGHDLGDFLRWETENVYALGE